MVLNLHRNVVIGIVLSTIEHVMERKGNSKDTLGRNATSGFNTGPKVIQKDAPPLPRPLPRPYKSAISLAISVI